MPVLELALELGIFLDDAFSLNNGRLLETGDFRLLEDGFFRLLEAA